MSSTVKLLTKAIESSTNFLEAKRLGVTERSFYTPDEKAVWGFIGAYFQRHTNVPPLEDITRLVPAFMYTPETTMNVSELVDRVHKERVEITLRASIANAESNIAMQQYDDAVAELHRGASAASSSMMMSKDITMSSHSGKLYQMYLDIKHGGRMRGIPWPWAPLNEATGGIQPGTFNVIYGRMKSTKTFRLLEIACAAQRAGKRSLVVSCEMAEEVLLNRTAAIQCHVDYGQVLGGSLFETDEARFREYLTSRNTIPYEQEIIITSLTDNIEGRTVSSLMAKIDEYKPDILLVDSLYKMVDQQTKKRDADPKTIRNISYDLQHLCQALKLPSVITTQANRKGERARLWVTGDAAFSDAFAMDCDLMLRLDNDKRLERTVFLVQAARETTLDGFSVGNKCCHGLGPIMLPNGQPDWKLPSKYLGEDEEESKETNRFND